jgi:chlorophyll synthase
VAFGVDTAKWICVSTIDVTQLGVAAYLYAGLNQPTYAAVLLGLILPQIYFQAKFFLPDPIANDVKYQVGLQSHRCAVRQCRNALQALQFYFHG